MAKCPKCGTPGAYIGFNSVECKNSDCENYVLEMEAKCGCCGNLVDGCSCGQVVPKKPADDVGNPNFPFPYCSLEAKTVVLNTPQFYSPLHVPSSNWRLPARLRLNVHMAPPTTPDLVPDFFKEQALKRASRLAWEERMREEDRISASDPLFFDI